LPQALVNLVALLGWHDQDDKEVFHINELIRAFTLERVQKGGAIFDTEKLQWINGQHIRRLSPSLFHDAIQPYLDPDWNVTDAMVESVQTKINLLSDVRDQLEFFFEDPVMYNDAAREALTGAEAAGILSMLSARLEEVSDFNGEWFIEEVKSIGEDFGLKGRELWHPIRAAIAGRVVGPDMVTIVETFGLDKCRERIRAALADA
jgi:glutamyl/glutaminyl-tRNA synthetase